MRLAVEQFGPVQTDSTEGQPVFALSNKLAIVQLKVTARVMLRIVDHHQVRQSIRRTLQLLIWIIGPDITIDHQERRVAEEVQRTEYATAGLERRPGFP